MDKGLQHNISLKLTQLIFSNMLKGKGDHFAAHHSPPPTLNIECADQSQDDTLTYHTSKLMKMLLVITSYCMCSLVELECVGDMVSESNDTRSSISYQWSGSLPSVEKEPFQVASNYVQD